ncbi:hypothetical protein BV20DRAFT_904633, partial [Pilatotrama ljubarskyi]
APYPFDKPAADIILRSSDLVEFRVRSHILIEASPVFESMLSLPQPPSMAGSESISGSDLQPTVDLAEDGETLETLLRICYPIANPTLDRPLDELETVLRAAIKYDMDFPTIVLSDRLLALASRSPLEVWAVAVRLRLETVARGAAEALLSVASPDYESLGSMAGICAGDYFRLRKFHR